MIIQICALTSNAEEAEVELFYEELKNLLELTPQNDVLFIIGGTGMGEFNSDDHYTYYYIWARIP